MRGRSPQTFAPGDLERSLGSEKANPRPRRELREQRHGYSYPFARVVCRGPINGTNGWREWQGGTWIRSLGCYAWQIDGTNFGNVIAFEAIRAKRKTAAWVSVPDARPP